MTTTVRTNQAEDLALSLYLTSWAGHTFDDWSKAHPTIRQTHRQQAARLIEEGHLNRILLDHEQTIRGRWGDLIRRSIPTAPDTETSLQRMLRQAATGALESAATIVRGRPA